MAGQTWINNPPLPHLPCSPLTAYISQKAFNSQHTESVVSVTVRSTAGFRYLKHIPSKKTYKVLSERQVLVRLTERRGKRRLGADRPGAGG